MEKHRIPTAKKNKPVGDRDNKIDLNEQELDIISRFYDNATSENSALGNNVLVNNVLGNNALVNNALGNTARKNTSDTTDSNDVSVLAEPTILLASPKLKNNAKTSENPWNRTQECNTAKKDDDDKTVLDYKSKPTSIDQTKTTQYEIAQGVKHNERTVIGYAESTKKSVSSIDAADGAGIQIGALIKARFKLISVIGVGGMGVVYKAKDLRQEEAGDHNPYIALKILSPEFRDHPKFLVALQQETKKTQLLSHHNIVNVYDFDRDDEIVFMTMELLEGIPLDEMIQQGMLPDNQQDRFNIIKGMAQGLQYAHANGIVHSDFKPSNVFVENDGNVKIFDFGIARAVEKEDGFAVKNSHFDATDLGALTPVYASLSMLEGQPVRAEDDYYALGCVAYMVLCGKHPYQKKSAKEVKDQSLDANKIETLSRKQWQALFQLIDVSSDGVGGLQNLLDVFFPVKVNKKTLYLVMLFVVIPTFAVALMMGSHWINNQNAIKEINTTLNSQDVTASKLLAAIENIPPGHQEYVTDSLREPLLDYFQRQVESLSDMERFEFDLLMAKQLVQALDNLFVDSARVTKMRTELLFVQGQIMKQLRKRYDQLLQNQVYWSPDDGDDLASVIDRIRRTTEKTEFIDDENVREGYIRFIKERLFYEDVITARSAASKAVKLYPEDETLRQLEGQMIRMPDEVDNVQRSLDHAKEVRENQEQIKALDGLNKAIVDSMEKNMSGELIRADHIVGFMNDMKRIDAYEYAAIYKSLEIFLTETLNTPNSNAVSENKERGDYLDFAKVVMPHRYKEPPKPDVKKQNCPSGWAGKGNSPNYRCSDRISKQYAGPQLVVIPARKNYGAFAITQYEVTENQYSIYCKLYKKCKPSANASDLPITGLSLNQMNRYARWLSKVTGEQYRLPTNAEWSHAATQSHRMLVKDHNCKVVNGGKIIRGHRLRLANEGYEDSYGLVNMIGNVAEVALDKNIAWRRGGSIYTRFNDCDTSLRRSYDGKAHADVGFRLVRKI